MKAPKDSKEHEQPIPKRRRRFAERPVAGGPDRAAWINAARAVLIAEGVHAVKVDRLAKALGVTRGGFYWRFADLQDLLSALVEDWRVSNGVQMVAPLATSGRPIDRFRAFAAALIEEGTFSSAYDMAVRAWARTDSRVNATVKRVDALRLGVMTGFFQAAGYRDEEADIRARIAYYHQIGFYVLDEKKTVVERQAWSEGFIEILTGLTII